MKKLAILFIVGFALVLGVSSCKSAEDCPAYSKTTVEKTADRA